MEEYTRWVQRRKARHCRDEDQDVEPGPSRPSPYKRQRMASPERAPPASSPVRVKKEPDDGTAAAGLSSLGEVATKPAKRVRATFKKNQVAVTGSFRPPRKRHTCVNSASEIDYSPERAIKEGMKMLGSQEDVINLVAFQNTLRQTALKDNVKMLTASAVTPKTTIAICGATGVGKSSLLNALLEDKIVPSSGTGACTSVVTEIMYHKEDTIVAEVSFDSKEEWIKEVSLIQEDIASRNDDEDAIYEERATKPPDSQSPAGIAWQKVHAVYPSLELEDLAAWSAEEVIAMNPDLAAMLGTTKRIECPDSDAFQDEIVRYIGSRAQNHQMSSENAEPLPEMWPLITKVVVYCDAKVLSTGASFVDLPGVADSNSARDNIAKEYLQNASHFWVIAPINRAVSDKTARDLLGERFKMQLKSTPSPSLVQRFWCSNDLLFSGLHDHAITFIATKCDQLTSSEVIREFRLRDNLEFQKLEARIKANTPEALKANLSDLKQRKDDCRAHMKALRRGEVYTSKYAKTQRSTGAGPSTSRQNPFPADSQLESELGGVHPTLEDLERKNRVLRKKIDDMTDRIMNCNPTSFEKEKKAFCALRRSEYSQKKLKADFREGITDLDGDELDPLKDYSDVNLPVFTCSSTDYLRLQGRSEDDGPSECFSNAEQTGIPSLQKWVHEITASSRHKGATAFLSQLFAFTQQPRTFLIQTRRALRLRWETGKGKETGMSHRLSKGFSDAVEDFVDTLIQHFRDGLGGKCKAGAAQASHSAVSSLDQFANSLYWSTYRAALRRHGRFRKYDLNETLTRPMTTAIFHSWPTLFNSVTFEVLEEAVLGCVDQILEDFKDSAPPSLEGSSRVFSNAREVLVREQKKLSRSLDDHIANELHDAYVDAAAQTGKGSVRRQKTMMKDHLDKNRVSIFNSGSDAILDGTDNAMASIGEGLEMALGELARKVEMDLSVLWELVKKDAPQVRARQHLSTLAIEIQAQIKLWQGVAQTKEGAQRRVMDNY
ncbi:hypothetical protein FA13DRAFT_1777161 [Coprinellus micaceus]|uniref:G domain-containing protein n=1 Tax=Coprinellus micaceus TaxID=71717 RepID=A0A4Y7SWA4_COPMI|nr:hypothetical protein FA13DRAFT_1777161 [Coprinellus micaceus]